MLVSICDLQKQTCDDKSGWVQAFVLQRGRICCTTAVQQSCENKVSVAGLGVARGGLAKEGFMPILLCLRESGAAVA